MRTAMIINKYVTYILALILLEVVIKAMYLNDRAPLENFISIWTGTNVFIQLVLFIAYFCTNIMTVDYLFAVTKEEKRFAYQYDVIKELAKFAGDKLFNFADKR